jgi:hypothetical protein
MSEEAVAEPEVIEPSFEVKDLIQHALDQDYNKANKVFGDMMGVKVNDLLDQEKIKLADQIFNDVESEEDDEDDEDYTQGELDLEGESESESEESGDEEEVEDEDEEEDVADEEEGDVYADDIEDEVHEE